MSAQTLLIWAAGLLLPVAQRPSAEEKRERERLRDTLTAQEKRVWEALRTGDADALRDLVTGEYRDIGGPGDGRLGTAEALKRWGDLRIIDYALDDVGVVVLNKEAAVLTYTARVRGSVEGKDLPHRAYTVSSAWVRRGGKWLSELRQWTPVVEKSARQVVEAFDLVLVGESLRCTYRGPAELQDVRVEVALTFRDGGNLSQIKKSWGTWQPGESKDVGLGFLVVSVDQVERAVLSGSATMGGKPATLSATARRQR